MDREDCIEKQINRILYILESDPKTNKKGVVESLEEVREEVQQLKMNDIVFKAKATVWGTVGGVVVSALFMVGKFLITKILF